MEDVTKSCAVIGRREAHQACPREGQRERGAAYARTHTPLRILHPAASSILSISSILLVLLPCADPQRCLRAYFPCNLSLRHPLSSPLHPYSPQALARPLPIRYHCPRLEDRPALDNPTVHLASQTHLRPDHPRPYRRPPSHARNLCSPMRPAQ